MFTIIPRYSSLQYSSRDPVSITHGLGLLLTQLAAPSVYSLHPNMFGILITSLHYSSTQEHIVSDIISAEQVFLYPMSPVIIDHDM